MQLKAIYSVTNYVSLNKPIDCRLAQRKLTYFVRSQVDSPENTNLRENITVQLTSCLTGLDSAALFMFNQQ